MAIIIPSKHIYGDRQNAKVRDNVIERIEVSAKKVVPDNKYETSVHSEKITSGWETNEIVDNTGIGFYNASGIQNLYHKCVAYLSLTPIYTQVKITINRLKENSYIEKIYTRYKDKDEEDKTPQINCTVRAIKQIGTASAKAHYNMTLGDVARGVELLETPELTQTERDETVSGIEEPLLSYEYTNYPDLSKANAELDYTIDEGIVGGIVENEDTFEFDIKVLVGYEQIKMGWDEREVVPIPAENDVLLEGTYVNYIPQQLEITIYGDTIGIDLKDETVYINDKNAKKVHKVDGNELMQTDNYLYFGKEWVELVENTDYTTTLVSANRDDNPPYKRAFIYFSRADLIGKNIRIKFLEIDEYGVMRDSWSIERTTLSKSIDTGTQYYFTHIEVYYDKSVKQPAIETRFADTQAQYARGKETATIRCSISDYYDSDNGIKVISIDNSTNKMSFQEGDIVIPMVYGADGQDRPMSTYQDGTAKQFMVLGAKKFFDGAVWQELYLQEIAQPIDN